MLLVARPRCARECRRRHRARRRAPRRGLDCCARRARQPAGDAARSVAGRSLRSRSRRRSATTTLQRGARSARMRRRPSSGLAYGNLAMLLHAGEYYDAAEPAYLNAAGPGAAGCALAVPAGPSAQEPGQPGQGARRLHAGRSRSQPNDVPTLIWLGRLYLDQGRAGEGAAALRARADAARRAWWRRSSDWGRRRWRRRDYAARRRRARGGAARAPHRGERALAAGDGVPRPWRHRQGRGASQAVAQHRGAGARSGAAAARSVAAERAVVRAARRAGAGSRVAQTAEASREPEGAEGFFRKGIPLAPGDTMLGRSLRHKLATALVLSGRRARRRRTASTEVVRLAPQDGPDETAAKAHYSLGVLMASAGRGADAIRHLSAAVKFNPNYLEARQGLGRRVQPRGPARAGAGRVRRDRPPQSARRRRPLRVRDGLVRLNRYREARDWLPRPRGCTPTTCSSATRWPACWPPRPTPPSATAPRRWRSPSSCCQTDKTTQLGETLAMAYAEVGNFSEAAGRAARACSRRVAAPASRPDVRRMTANLRLYERGQACRTPWQTQRSRVLAGPAGQPRIGRLAASARRQAAVSLSRHICRIAGSIIDILV